MASLDPEKQVSFSYLGAALRRVGRFEEAIDACDRALELGDPCPFALYSRSLSRFNLGDAAGARSDLDNALAIWPEDPVLIDAKHEMFGE